MRRVFTCFEDAPEVHEAAIAFDKVAIDFRPDLSFIQQASTITRADLAIAGQPTERVRVQLVPGVIVVTTAANLLNNAVARLEGEEQKSDDLVHLEASRAGCPPEDAAPWNA